MVEHMFDEKEQRSQGRVPHPSLLPAPIAWDDPGFDAFLDELTAVWAAELGVSTTGETGPRIDDPVAVLTERMVTLSRCQGLVFEAMAAIADAYDTDDGLARDVGLVFEAAAAEIRASLRLTRRAADRQLDLALTLTQRLPAVLSALKCGRIDTPRAVVIADATSHLPEDIARAVADQILDQAGRLTTGQIRARLTRLAIQADPDAATDHYRHAHSERRVVLQPSDTGTADLLITDVAPDRAAAARRHIDAIARSLRSPHETRSIDQLRADVAIDLLTGATTQATIPTGSPRTNVNLTVDLATLIGWNDNPAELAGYGPVIADIARQTLTNLTRSSDGTWQYTVTDPDTSRPIASGITRRRPTVAQQRTVTTANPTCIFPGCRMPSIQSDLDHRRPWSENGPTTIENLVPLCRHDHRLKHDHGWQHQPLPNGNHQWTSPLGNTYTTTGQSP